MDGGEKLNCKYRKSCYSTGQKAPVEDYNFNIEFHPIEWFLSLGEGTGKFKFSIFSSNSNFQVTFPPTRTWTEMEFLTKKTITSN